MSKGKQCSVICDGEIEICLLNDNDDVEEALEVLRKSFFTNENLCIGCDVNQPNSEAAISELTALAREISKDGVSLIARHIASRKIVGVALNKMHQSCITSKSAQEEFLGNFLNSTCKTENVSSIMKFLSCVENKFDIFNEWNVDCIIEHFMLATLPEFGKRNIGYNLSLQSIQLAIELGQIDKNINCNFLPKHLQHCRPKAIYAIFTSKFSHKIGERLGFQDLAIVPYSEFIYKGVKLSDKLDPIHKDCILGARKF